MRPRFSIAIADGCVPASSVSYNKVRHAGHRRRGRVNVEFMTYLRRKSRNPAIEISRLGYKSQMTVDARVFPRFLVSVFGRHSVLDDVFRNSRRAFPRAIVGEHPSKSSRSRDARSRRSRAEQFVRRFDLFLARRASGLCKRTNRAYESKGPAPSPAYSLPSRGSIRLN